MCWTSAAQASAIKQVVKSSDACRVSPRPGDGHSPFRGVCEYLDTRQGVAQVALFDFKTHRTYLFSNGDNTQYTASVAKADILAVWLHHYDEQGTTIPDGIPYSIKYLMTKMIESSDNAAATGLFYFGGGCKALERFNALIPLRATTVGCQTPTYYGWGNTTTTAADQLTLMKVFASGQPPGVLGHSARDYGLHLMQGVEPDQRFGITCGPWGAKCDRPDYAKPVPGVTVSLKNGWKTLPTCTRPIEQCPWQVNSSGWVNGKGRDYVLTVLTTEDPVGTGDLFGYHYGIDTIQGVSKHIWSNLG
jgi:hypothetical protein